MKKRTALLGILSVIGTAAVSGSVLVDFDAAAGPADVVGDITVVIDIGTDGSAILNSISSSGNAQAVTEVSGTVTKLPAAPYSVTLFIATGNGRQTGIGLVGVGNNFIDADETMTFSFNADNAGSGTQAIVTEVAIDPDNASWGTAAGTLTDPMANSLPFTFSSDARESFDATGLSTGVPAGSGLAASISITGTAPRFQFAAIAFDMVEGGAAPGWAGYPIANSNGDVDTGAWLGWINVSHGDWVWKYSTGQWVYLPEDYVTDGGAWAYFGD